MLQRYAMNERERRGIGFYPTTICTPNMRHRPRPSLQFGHHYKVKGNSRLVSTVEPRRCRIPDGVCCLFTLIHRCQERHHDVLAMTWHIHRFGHPTSWRYDPQSTRQGEGSCWRISPWWWHPKRCRAKSVLESTTRRLFVCILTSWLRVDRSRWVCTSQIEMVPSTEPVAARARL